MGLGDLAAQASRSTGLSANACRELLDAGWTLERKIGAPTAWVSPMARMTVAQVAPVAQSVHGLGGSVETAVAARLAYDMDHSQAAVWLAAEDQLTPEQYARYQSRYAQAVGR